jgi:hypothetical protein
LLAGELRVEVARVAGPPLESFGGERRVAVAEDLDQARIE